MTISQMLLTAFIGLLVSIVTAIVTHKLTQSQERKRHEREIKTKIAELNSTERSKTMLVALQYGHSCFVVERPDQTERDRVFLPVGSRITLGSDLKNHIVLNHEYISGIHTTFTAQGDSAFIEPLDQANGIEVNSQKVEQPRKLSTGDIITIPGAPYKITFVRLVS